MRVVLRSLQLKLIHIHAPCTSTRHPSLMMTLLCTAECLTDDDAWFADLDGAYQGIIALFGNLQDVAGAEVAHQLQMVRTRPVP